MFLKAPHANEYYYVPNYPRDSGAPGKPCPTKDSVFWGPPIFKFSARGARKSHRFRTLIFEK